MIFSFLVNCVTAPMAIDKFVSAIEKFSIEFMLLERQHHIMIAKRNSFRQGMTWDNGGVAYTFRIVVLDASSTLFAMYVLMMRWMESAVAVQSMNESYLKSGMYPDQMLIVICNSLFHSRHTPCSIVCCKCRKTVTPHPPRLLHHQ